MSTLDAAKAILQADATLLATAIGGVWDFDSTGRLGLSRTTTPAAFDAAGRIKPCILLKLRSCEPAGLADGGSQFVTTREMLEAWFYEDTGYANITAMRERVWTLLHNVQLSGTFVCLWAGDVRPGFRDPDLDASVERSDYAVIGKRT